MIHAISTISPILKRRQQYLDKIAKNEYLPADFTKPKLVTGVIENRSGDWAYGYMDVPSPTSSGKNSDWGYGYIEVPSPAPLSKDWLDEERQKWLDEDFDFKTPDPRVNRMPGQRPSGYFLQTMPYLGEAIPEFVDGHVPEGIPDLGCEKGWMLDRLIRTEIEINGRYLYWQQTREKGALLDRPIPKIKFRKKGFQRKPLSHLKYCLDLLTDKWRDPDEVEHRIQAIGFFFDWLLWSLGHPSVESFPLVEEYCPEENMESWRSDIHNVWFQVFDVKWLLLWPDDYFGVLLHEYGLIDKPPSHRDCLRKATKLFPDYKDKEYRTNLVVDPQCGTGRYSMALSNFTLNIAPVQLNNDLFSVQACLLNFYLFCPWGLSPLVIEQSGSESDVLAQALQLVAVKNLSADYFVVNEPDDELREYDPIIIYSRKQTEQERPESEGDYTSLPASSPKLIPATTSAVDNLEQALKTLNERLVDCDRRIDDLLALLDDAMPPRLDKLKDRLMDCDRRVGEMLDSLNDGISPTALPLPKSESSDTLPLPAAPSTDLMLPMPSASEEFLPLPMPSTSEEFLSLPMPSASEFLPLPMPSTSAGFLPIPVESESQSNPLPLPAVPADAIQGQLPAAPLPLPDLSDTAVVIDAEILEADNQLSLPPVLDLDQNPF